MTPSLNYPRRQSELLKAARGVRTQRAFASELGVGPTALSKYEAERLGAPVKVLNQCLAIVASTHAGGVTSATPLERALKHAESVVAELKAAGSAPTSRRASSPS